MQAVRKNVQFVAKYNVHRRAHQPTASTQKRKLQLPPIEYLLADFKGAFLYL